MGALVAAGMDIELMMIGEGSQRRSVEERVRGLGIESRVALTGFHPNPSGLLATCHLYVQPSLSEGFGLALVEAMGCGLPVIAGQVGGPPEFIEPGRTGWLVETSDACSIGEAIADAAALAPADLAKMGEAARVAVSERFAIDRYITTIEQLYDQLSRPASHAIARA